MEPQSTRRTLDFRTFEEILADITHLRAAGYQAAGQWDLATTCNHLAKGIEVGIENQKVEVSLMLRLLAPLLGKLIFKRLLKTRRMPDRIKAPAIFVPDSDCEINASIERPSAPGSSPGLCQSIPSSAASPSNSGSSFS